MTINSIVFIYKIATVLYSTLVPPRPCRNRKANISRPSPRVRIARKVISRSIGFPPPKLACKQPPEESPSFYFNSLRLPSRALFLPSNATSAFIETYPPIVVKGSAARSRYRAGREGKRTEDGRVRLDSAFRSEYRYGTYRHEENREPAFRLTQQTSRAFGTKKDTFVRITLGGYYGVEGGRGQIEPLESNFEETTKLTPQWGEDLVPRQTLDENGGGVSGRANDIVDPWG
ncbi:hypothetical protein K0M31_001028 [Melipona bicolor]|uniref:Uncharacterized protein n=1 Tax=Melipona bicolor TaxID=60889 RepID=A0AA40GER4_9HYME|nr:hypothetical protein K0M31_001028 [Melipona bicolor]